MTLTSEAALPQTPSAPGGQQAALRSMARGSLANLLGVGWAGVLSFVLVVVLTKGLGPHTYGVFAIAMALYTIVSNIAELGADTGVLRELPRLKVLGREAETPVVLLVALVPAFLAGALCTAVVWIWAPQIAPLVVKSRNAAHAQQSVDYLRALAPFFAVGSVTAVALAAARGLGNQRLYIGLQNVLQPTARPLLALALIIAGFGGVAVTVSWAVPVAVSGLLALLALRSMSRRMVATAEREGRRERRPVREISAEFWRFSAARGLAGALAVIISWIGIVLLGSFRSASEAGVFSAVTRYVIFGTFAFQAMRVAIGPQISSLVTQGRIRDAEAVFQTATWWLTAMSWPFYLLMIVLPGTFLDIFGGGFRTGATALIVVSVANLINMATGNVTLVLLMSGASSWNLFNIALGLVVNIALNVTLIPRYGVLGAAIALAVTTIVENVAAMIEVRLLLAMSPFGGGYAYATAAPVLCFLVLGAAVRPVLGDRPITLAVVLLLGGAAYLVLLWRWRHHLRFEVLQDALGPRAFAGRLGRSAAARPVAGATAAARPAAARPAASRPATAPDAAAGATAATPGRPGGRRRSSAARRGRHRRPDPPPEPRR